MVVATWSLQCRCEGPCTFSRSPVWGGVGNKLESLLSNVKESDVLTIAFSSGNWLLLQMRGISHLLRSSGVNVCLQHLERRNTWSNPVFFYHRREFSLMYSLLSTWTDPPPLDCSWDLLLRGWVVLQCFACETWTPLSSSASSLPWQCLRWTPRSSP